MKNGGYWTYDNEIEKDVKVIKEFNINAFMSNEKEDEIKEDDVLDEKNISEINKIEKSSFDDEVNQKGNIEDLRMSLIKEYLYDVDSHLYKEVSTLSKEELLKELNMIDDELRPKNIGLLMFSDGPNKFISGYQIELVDFTDTSFDEFTEKIFHGPIQDQIRGILRYIENNVIKSKNIDGNSIFNYPIQAIKEVVIGL